MAMAPTPFAKPRHQLTVESLITVNAELNALPYTTVAVKCKEIHHKKEAVTSNVAQRHRSKTIRSGGTVSTRLLKSLRI